MNAVDTNILIYIHDPRDPIKQEKAEHLVASLTDGVLLWQVACEFVAASRKLAAFGFTVDRLGEKLRKPVRFGQRNYPIGVWRSELRN